MFGKISAVFTAGLIALAMLSVTVSADSYSEEFDMYEFISVSDSIVLASYAGSSGSEYRFRMIRTLKDDMPETYFYLTADERFASGLTVNGRYVLFLDRDISVYYPHDRCTAVNGVLMTADSRNTVTGMTAGGIPVENYPESVSSLKRYISEVPDLSEKPRDYIRSEDAEDIIRQSDCIVSAEIKERTGGADKGCGYYRCTVKESFKGDISGEFTIELFDSKVRTGETYYLLINKNTGGYVLSSKKSIYALTDSSFAVLLGNG